MAESPLVGWIQMLAAQMELFLKMWKAETLGQMAAPTGWYPRFVGQSLRLLDHSVGYSQRQELNR